VPVLLVGDTAWSLIVELSDADTLRYLDDRRARGVNLILVNLIEHQFSSHQPPWRTAKGVLPFSNVNDFSTLSKAYLDRVEWVVKAAANRGIGVLLVPAYVGIGCGGQGWCAEMRANGPARLKAYGRLLGTRLRAYPNVIWTHGGDTTPSDSDLKLVLAIKAGIDETVPAAMHAYHWGSGDAPAADKRLTDIDIDTIYSYETGTQHRPGLAARALNAGVRPFIFIEGTYENEHGASPATWREQMYGPILTGGAGFVFGNYPIWPFAAPGAPNYGFGDGKFAKGWTEALGGPGSRDLARAAGFFRGLRWYSLQPDLDGVLLTAGAGRQGLADYAVMTRSADKRLAVGYFPSRRTFTIDLRQMAGSLVEARWFSPASGKYNRISGSPFSTERARTFTSPGPRTDGTSDWILLLERLS
jgi:hypothetical protein